MKLEHSPPYTLFEEFNYAFLTRAGVRGAGGGEEMGELGWWRGVCVCVCVCVYVWRGVGWGVGALT